MVYSPESRFRSPGKLLLSIGKGFMQGRDLAWRLFLRDTISQYRQSLLGILWAFIPPVTLGILFAFLKARSVLNLGETDIPYPVYVVIGITLWHMFLESMSTPRRVIRQSQSMFTKINFPWEGLILSAFYQLLFSGLIKSLVIVGTLLCFRVQVSWMILAAPVSFLMIILLGFTISLVLTPIGLIYDDVWKLLNVITPFWFFLTPVMYPPIHDFPFSVLNTVNPISPLLLNARDLLTLGIFSHAFSFSVVTLLTFVMLFVAVVIYRASLPVLIERMSN